MHDFDNLALVKVHPTFDGFATGRYDERAINRRFYIEASGAN
jgi:hypothetical protein